MNSFKYAIKGIGLAAKLDRNVRFHIVVAFVVLLASYFLKISKLEFIFVLFSIFFVLITEMINTAIEEMTNLITKEHHREAMIAKDVAAAAVLLAAIFAAVIGLIIFMPYVFGYYY